MSKVNGFETDILKLILQNVNLANVGDATGLRGSTVAGTLFIALLTADPGESGTLTEASYGGYARKSIARSAGEWDVTNGVGSNINAQAFAECTSGSATVTHFAICTGVSGANAILYGALSAPRNITAGSTPNFAASTLTITED